MRGVEQQPKDSNSGLNISFGKGDWSSKDGTTKIKGRIQADYLSESEASEDQIGTEKKLVPKAGDRNYI